MKILLFIYACSWALLLLVLAYSLIFEKQKFKEAFDESPWIYVAIFLLAPIVILLIPYILISSIVRERKTKRRNAEWQQKQQKEEDDKKLAKFRYIKAVSNSNNLFNKEFVDFAHSIFNNVKEERYRDVIKALNSIQPINGAKLDIELCQQVGSGDESKLFIYYPNGTHDYDIFKHLTIDISSYAAWQVYILISLRYILPLWWHANYSRRQYVLNKFDLSAISTYRKMSLEFLANENLQPSIYKYGDNYYVSACFWSEFGGLIREYVEITIKDNKVINILPFDKDVLYKYNCGIMF